MLDTELHSFHKINIFFHIIFNYIIKIFHDSRQFLEMFLFDCNLSRIIGDKNLRFPLFLIFVFIINRDY